MKKLITIIAVVSLSVMCLAGCGGGSTTLASDATLEITGGGLDLKYDAEDLEALPTETITTENVSSSGEVAETEIVAISLSSILEENGIDLQKVTSVELSASDGYVMSAPQSEYANSDIYIILSQDGESLDYPRSAIPEKRAMYWVKNLNKITIEADGAIGGVSLGPVDTISFFREGISNLDSEKVADEDGTYNAYSNEDYFEEFFGGTPDGNIALEAEDGLKKTESADLFFDNHVTIDKNADDTPLYYGEDIKPGMKLKGLKYAAADGNGVYYGTEIDLKSLFADLQMEDASKYKFTAIDGFSVEIPADAIASGKVFLDDGVMTTDFGSYDLSSVKGKGNIKGLVSIEAVN